MLLMNINNSATAKATMHPGISLQMGGSMNSSARMALVFGLTFAAVHAARAGAGVTLQGESFLSGGTGSDERAMLEQKRGSYNLWIRTATKEGAYVSDAGVRITDDGGRLVLDAIMDGPWLYLNLKQGRYSVGVKCEGKAQRQQVSISPGSHHELMFRCEETVDLLPRGATQ
jgi:hypothetical protein